MVEKNKLLAVIRVRGRVKVRGSIGETLERLRLSRVNNLVLVSSKSDSYLGMVMKCKDFVTFGEIDKDVLSKLLAAKDVDVSEEAVSQLISCEKTAKELKIEMPLRMHPPRHGYEGIKKDFKSGGALGYRSSGINELIRRMI
jgi:large subunit ribosomal protein L30